MPPRIHTTQRWGISPSSSGEFQRAPSLFATWRYHAFVTNLAGSAWALDRSHRAHAVVELSIRDLKAGPLAHLPSGSFNVNRPGFHRGSLV